ncbi:hypothetical protein Pyn_03127 [Prunus yedoensis var. nudiflora]|uniref:Uncharacterized protein n=1 Tax=Prunus yedoensis var. nudiflora TaxID=2094558 RepID=A0A314UJ86_PRUYE|nr:hypothetical protein Pyn_03127 [Prunus yedoensis var. nudiflora]
MSIPFPEGDEASGAYDLLQQPIMQFMERHQKLHQEDHLGYWEHLDMMEMMTSAHIGSWLEDT